MDWMNIYTTRIVLLIVSILLAGYYLKSYIDSNVNVISIGMIVLAVICVIVGLFGKMWLRRYL